MSLFTELRRRNVFRVGIAYAVASWLLIQVSDTVFPRIGLSESAVTLVIALLGIGFVPALIFAWAFEMTPEGLKREKEVDRSQSITRQTGHKLDRLIIGVMAVIIAFLVLDRFVLRDAATPAPAPQQESQGIEPQASAATGPANPSVAVLPFVNMSADEENEYFSDGIAEELLNMLVRINDLDVASRTSSFSYKGKDLPLSRIAGELGVNHILEGSVRKAGNRVRITAQLIDADTDRHLWSDTYERELDDIFQIQEEISEHIVDALKVTLDVDEAADMARLQQPTDSAEAYELYLQGRFKWRQRLEANIRSAIGLFERAIELDPEFAKAHEALAVAHMVLPSWSDRDWDDALSEAIDHAERALALDPRLAEARVVLAESATNQLHWDQALSQYEAALEAEPRNPNVRQWYSESLHDVGYLDQALEQIEKAYQLDPASPVINNVYTFTAASAGRDELALRHMRAALELGIDFAARNALAALQRSGDWKTIENLVLPLADDTPMGSVCIEAHRDPSLYPVVRERLAELRAARERNANSAYCAALIGDLERAFEDLAFQLRADPTAIVVVWGLDPGFVAMRRSPRFKQVLRDLQLVDLYRKRGWPDRCRPLGTEDFTCG